MTPDQQRIKELLCGRTTRDERGLLHTAYLKDGSDEEKEARRALVRLLCTSRPLDLGVRFIIANLIDPDRDEINRRIRFENRRKGKPSNAAAEKEIAEFIWSKIRAGVKTESAIRGVMDKFGLGRSRALEIWGHWRPILKKLKREN